MPLLRKQLIAVVDPATTMICLDCAGQVRDLRDRFHTLVGDFQQPPFHRWCRSVVIPYLPGGVDDQRQVANAEIRRRPLKERRKGPGGVGARRVPPPHAATFEQRGQLVEAQSYAQLYERIISGDDQVHKSVISRHLVGDLDLDRDLRTGDLTMEQLELIDQLDAAVATGRITEQITVFTAISHPNAARLRVSDVVSDDSYLQVSLDPAVAARFGRPVALTLPPGLPAIRFDADTQRLLLARRHSWLLLALGVILVAVLL